MPATPWHASPRPNAATTGDVDTGEIRVPLELFSVDRSQGDVDLVLSRTEAEALSARLSYHLNRTRPCGRAPRVSGRV
ncbi:hypothetical protein [Streptomyces lunaelactis]|uniref:hypothetical protein n=1 Tax=Streptomyces lunaelactis TaxID=1535768 RepID=UPI001584952F|nr:hypothetical protein [Streptomyces lunaelactis]NUK22083.1 hypothetical protein [Streptomyces lunaelactis]NUL05997.1 hypothetical protein [Streptomyces lunaelactis]